MQRYFLELAYHGKDFGGFQIQQNIATIQSAVEKALHVFLKKEITLTGSSRTDAGVHALQNFFHFDIESELDQKIIYNLNALLPPSIVINNLLPVASGAHCRFDATSRDYRYHLYYHKNPFLQDRAYFFPYTLQVEKMNEAARALMQYNDFTSFSKRNTQVKTFLCKILESEWLKTETGFVYHVSANRFLRGMVRGLVGTMLQVGRGKLTLEDFINIIAARDCTKADFAVPAHGLFLCNVNFPYLNQDQQG